MDECSCGRYAVPCVARLRAIICAITWQICSASSAASQSSCPEKKIQINYAPGILQFYLPNSSFSTLFAAFRIMHLV